MLIVVGVISLLFVILLPPLQMAHRIAKQTRCAAQLMDIGRALSDVYNDKEFAPGYYPIWDDGAPYIRYTWIDVLYELRYMTATHGLAYCPEDPAPGPVNMARGRFHRIVYPPKRELHGMDYSYGISVPLASGRRFEESEMYPAQRVLAGDASWSTIYNLSGYVVNGKDWSYTTQYDNMVDWRHGGNSANLLLCDGHVQQIRYDTTVPGKEPVNTSQVFVWYSGEPLTVGPGSKWGERTYPADPPVDIRTGKGAIPAQLVPGWYTYNGKWSGIAK